MNEIEGAESPDDAFRRYLEAGEVRLQVCGDCGRQVFPPRVLCPRCGLTDLTWSVIDGSASVYSTTTVRQKPARGGDYNVCIVELTEGARMLSRVNGAAPADVTIGDHVVAVIDKIDDQPVVAFVPEAQVAS